jgi:hypothetical protein
MIYSVPLGGKQGTGKECKKEDENTEDGKNKKVLKEK